MHGLIWIFVPQLFRNLSCLFQSCPCDYQTSAARVRTTGIVGISSHPLNHANTFLSDTFVYLPYHSWWTVHVHIKRSDVTMVRRWKMFYKIICQVFKPWCPYHTVDVQVYLIDQPKYWPFIDRNCWHFIVLLQIPLAVLLYTNIVVGPCFQPISSRVRRNTFPPFAL